MGIAETTRLWRVGKGATVKRPQISFDEETFASLEKWDIRLRRERSDLLARNRPDALFPEYSMLAAPETDQRLGAILGMGLRCDSPGSLQRLKPGFILNRFTNSARMRDFFTKRGISEWTKSG